jgi:hypothetical protein
MYTALLGTFPCGLILISQSKVLFGEKGELEIGV